jgi:N-acetylglutamate synthase-like GNAT family acetyltransferase
MRDYATRVAELADVASVGTLLQRSYPELMGVAYEESVLVPALKLLTRAKPSLLASGRYYVAESRSARVVGCGGWSLERPGTNTVELGMAHIRHFATHPEWTQRGIGRAIFNLCETAARSAGAHILECHSSLNAEGFYAALGFESVRMIQIDLGLNVVLPAILMRRTI